MRGLDKLEISTPNRGGAWFHPYGNQSKAIFGKDKALRMSFPEAKYTIKYHGCNSMSNLFCILNLPNQPVNGGNDWNL